MRQFTIKRVVEGLQWLANNDHFEVGVEYNDDNKIVARYFRNHHVKMRVPEAMMTAFSRHIRVNTRKFDTRMYVPNAAGKRLIEVSK